jgi:predicted secreted Zn-dependent protease
VRQITFIVVFLATTPWAVAQSNGSAHVGEVQRHVDIEYYAVEGATVGELARSLLERGPINNGSRYFGQTDWTINAEYEWIGDHTGCRIESLVVRVLVTLTLPRWDPPRNAPAELRSAWTGFARALTAHEHNHRRLAEEAADAIRWDLATLRYSDCRHSDERARQRVTGIIDEYSRRNRAYDEHTDHGGKEGALWPPRSLPRGMGSR